MKLSIVVPTFNQGPYIEDCLKSISAQNFADYEVLIQDGLSWDETERICRSFCRQDPRFKYFREQDFGQSDAINRALERSTGKYWTWICSDDRYSNSECLGRLVTTFSDREIQDPECVGVFGDAQFMDAAGTVLGAYGNFTRNVARNDFIETWPLSQPSLILKRIQVLEVGGIDTRLNLGMDLDLFFKYLQPSNYFFYSPGLVADIRLQPWSKSVNQRVQTAVNALNLVRRYTGSLGRTDISAYVAELGHARCEVFKGYFFRVRRRFDRIENFVFRATRKLLRKIPKLRRLPEMGRRIYYNELHRPFCSAIFRWTRFEAMLDKY